MARADMEAVMERIGPERRKPTHYCKLCNAEWIKWPDNTWSLYSRACGQCCDNEPMGEQIAPIEPPLTARDELMIELAFCRHVDSPISETADRILAIRSSTPDEGLELLGEARDRLSALADAEKTYRLTHDTQGAGNRLTGRAWDIMRREGDMAAAFVSRIDAYLQTKEPAK